VFANATPGQLLQGEVVEVHGQADATGVVHATRVERKAAGFGDSPEMEMKGVVKNLAAATFTLGDVTVNFSGAAFDAIIGSAAGLGDGMLVEVRSTQLPAADGAITATSIKAENPELEHGVEVRIEGLVTAGLDAAGEFKIDGQKVLVIDPPAANATAFRRGAKADIQPAGQMEAEGVVDANGVLVARHVSFELAKNVKIQAPVDSVDAEAGTVTALGITVKVNEQTRLRDKVQNARTLSVADLEGSWVDI